jgi:formylglycine-generating enzyme required for sulfatase activity
MPLSQGQILNNRYRIVKLLGQSSFGTVYRAWDLNTQGPCVVEEMPDSEAARVLFSQRSSLLLSLQHPHLPRVFDAFSLPGEGLYLSTAFVEGEDLQSIFERTNGPLPESQVLPWMIQVCDTLAYLHAQQPPMFHGGLKPANIRITPDGTAMLVGLGVLAVFDPRLQSIAIPQAVAEGFSPPEQYSQGRVEARSEVYALGAILYMLLCGVRLPESSLIKGKDVLPPRPVREMNPQVDPLVSNVVDRAIQIEPEKRYASVEEVKQALVQAQPGVAPASTPVGRKRTSLYRVVGCAVLGGLLLAVLIVGGWLAYPHLVKSLATHTPTRTSTATLTPQPKNTSTSRPPTATFTPVASPSPTSPPLRLVDKFGVPMVLVEGGSFLMGSDYGAPDETPQHSVTLKTFYIDQYEVTNTRYAECVKAGSCEPPTNLSSVTHPNYYDSLQFANYPVIQVTWAMAKAYCEWRGARLPTEAEWEKAARGTDGRTFPWGEQEADCTFANFWSGGPGCVGDVSEVGRYNQSASPFNVFDMAGNVWEWVLDWYGESYYAASPGENPTGPDAGQYRVVRGGSYSNGLSSIRTTTRGRNLPGKFYSYVGMRCIWLP